MMSIVDGAGLSFYYIRENGPDGEILVGDGSPPGEPLSRLLDRGPLGIRAALELLSYLADVLTIAEEDDATHGDIKPGYVHVDATGTVYLGGYGETRRGGRAPEGRTDELSTDIYGTGLVLISLLTTDSLGAIPRDPEAHDQLIVEKLGEVDWQELADRRWQEQIVLFLCSMLSHDPSARPAALDVANVLGNAAQRLNGASLSEWAVEELEPVTESSPSIDEEDLSGAHRIGSTPPPRVTPARQAASSKGESTAFWTREKIAEMLHESKLGDDPPRYTPPELDRHKGLLSRLPPEIPELPDATLSARGRRKIRETVPVLVPADGVSETSIEVIPPAAPVPSSPSLPPTPPPEPPPPEPPPVVQPQVPRPPPPVAPPVAPTAAPSSPGDGAPPPSFAPLPATEAPTKNINMVLILALGVVSMLIFAVGVGALLAHFLGDDKPRSRDRDEDREEEVKESKKTDAAVVGDPETSSMDDVDESDEEAASRPSSRDSSRSSSSRETRSSSSRDDDSAKSEPAEAPAEADDSIGEASVKLTLPGNAAYFCTPGDIDGEFNGRVEFRLDPGEHFYADAVSTCIVQMGEDFKERGKGEFKGSFLVRGLGEKSFTCGLQGKNISCSGG